MKHISKRISVILLSTVICCCVLQKVPFSALSRYKPQRSGSHKYSNGLKSWDIVEVLTEYTVGVPPMR